jgi:hypothetical protein
MAREQYQRDCPLLAVIYHGRAFCYVPVHEKHDALAAVEQEPYALRGGGTATLAQIERWYTKQGGKTSRHNIMKDTHNPHRRPRVHGANFPR